MRTARETIRTRPARAAAHAATMNASAQRERGSTIPLIIAYGLIVSALILGGILVTSAQLTRMSLYDVADAAALDASDGAVQGYSGGIEGSLVTTNESVRRDAAAFVASREKPRRVTSWSLGPNTGAPNGHTAKVELTADVQLPIVGSFLRGLGSQMTITVDSEAAAYVN